MMCNKLNSNNSYQPPVSFVTSVGLMILDRTKLNNIYLFVKVFFEEARGLFEVMLEIINGSLPYLLAFF